MMKVMKKVFGKIRKSLLICWDRVYRSFHIVNVMSTNDTLCEIINEKASISRFGDGEFSFMMQKDLQFQMYDEILANRMLDVLNGKGKVKNHIIAVPYVMADEGEFTKNSLRFWRYYFAKNRKNIYDMMNRDLKYGDSQISRIYINRIDKSDSVRYFQMWKRVWRHQNVVIVEGEKSGFGANNDLFDDAKSVRRVLCPAENAYQFFYEIKEYLLSLQEVDLFLIVLGPTATVLSYDLAREGKWAIDVGNLDMEYEWMKCGATTQIPIEGKYTMEVAEGTQVTNITDTKYQSQIINRIGCQ